MRTSNSDARCDKRALARQAVGSALLLSPSPPLFYRRKVILALLEALGGELRRTDFQKHLFLLTRNDPSPPYDFVPYQYGCYSFSAEADRAPMVRTKLLHDGDTWKKRTATPYVPQLKPDGLTRLRQHVELYGALRGEELVRAVYTQHPYFATRSRIAAEVLTADERIAVDSARPAHEGGTLFTLGYEGRSVESYLDLLLRHGVTVLCDVRRNPVSRKYGFSKKTLGVLTSKLGIRYIHVPELGIVSERRQHLDEPGARESLFEVYDRDVIPQKAAELDHLATLVKSGERVALTCFEAFEQDCHRSRIAVALESATGWSAPVEHL